MWMSCLAQATDICAYALYFLALVHSYIPKCNKLTFLSVTDMYV